MRSGFNTRIEYRGETYIVQTQDKGPRFPYVESLIYRSGTLLTSKKTSYQTSLSNPEIQAVIDRIMSEQHNTVLEDIVEGRFV